MEKIKILLKYIEINENLDKEKLLNFISDIKNDIEEKNDEIYDLKEDVEELKSKKSDLEFNISLYEELIPIINSHKVTIDVVSLYETVGEKMKKYSPNQIEKYLQNL